MAEFKHNDGGRSKYFKGDTGDCVARSIAIASGRDYKEIYDRLAQGNASQRRSKRDKRKRSRSARNGITTKRKWFKDYMRELGFEWVSCMGVGTGCTVHLHADELPNGRLVCSLTGHYTAVIDGVINDTFNPRRGAKVSVKDGIEYTKKEVRCVYGYWIFNKTEK